jgi:hypothetical protein
MRNNQSPKSGPPPLPPPPPLIGQVSIFLAVFDFTCKNNVTHFFAVVVVVSATAVWTRTRSGHLNGLVNTGIPVTAAELDNKKRKVKENNIIRS